MSGNPEPNRIDRRDDAGHTTTWFYAPGYAVSWAAFAGSPAILVSAFQQPDPTGPYQQVYWLVNGPNQATRLTFNSDQPGDLHRADVIPEIALGTAIADAHRLCIGGPNSLHLVRRDGTILRVFDGAVYPANGCF